MLNITGLAHTTAGWVHSLVRVFPVDDELRALLAEFTREPAVLERVSRCSPSIMKCVPQSSRTAEIARDPAAPERVFPADN